MAAMESHRVGFGWDSHAFAPGRPLWLGGVQIPHPRGLMGHSDGDVLLHAAADALFGALALGDIGTHFPPSDEAWRGSPSARFVEHALREITRRGWAVANFDATVILESPRLGPYRDPLRDSVAMLLNVAADRVSIKAKTPEGLPWADLAIAHCVALLERRAAPPPAGARI